MRKPVTLSLTLGLLTLGLLLLFSAGLLFWSYRSSQQALSVELRNSFKQRQSVIAGIFEQEQNRLDTYLLTALSAQGFMNEISENEGENAQQTLTKFTDLAPLQTPDIFLFIRHGQLLANASAMNDQTTPILKMIISDIRKTNDSIYRYINANTDLDLLVRSKRVIAADGHILGFLVAATILDDNLRLLDIALGKTQAGTIVWFDLDKIVGIYGQRSREEMQKLVHERQIQNTRFSSDLWWSECCYANDQAVIINEFPTRLATLIMVPDTLTGFLQKKYLREIIVLFITSLLCFGISIIFIKNIISSGVDQLISYTDIARLGRANEHCPVDRFVEFNEIGTAIERMYSDMCAANEEMRRQVLERNQTMSKIVTQQHQRTAILNAIDNAVIAITPARSIIMMNRVAELLTGINFDEAEGAPIGTVFFIQPADNQQQPIDGIDYVLHHRQNFSSNQYLLRAARGAVYRISFTIAPILDRDDSVSGLVIAFMDITDQFSAQNTLHRSENKFRRIFDGIRDAILIIRADNKKICDANQAFLALCSIGKKEILSKTVSEFSLTADDNTNLEEQIRRTLLDGPQCLKWHFHVNGNKSAEALLTLCRIEIEDTTCIIGVIRQESAHAEHKNELPETASEYNALAIGKFASAIAHDLNNFLGGIMGAADLLDARLPSDNPLHKYVSIISDTTTDASKVTEQLLQLKTGKLPEKTDPDPISQTENENVAAYPNANRTILNTQKDKEIGAGKIALLIDDEYVIRTTAEQMLTALGFKVIQAENGREGFALYQQNQNEIAIVILDMIMPEMNGVDTFRAIRKVNPHAKIILASGFAQADSVELLQQEGLCGFIKKPYRRHALAELIGAALHENA